MFKFVADQAQFFFAPLSTKKIPCELYRWGPMDPRFQKKYLATKISHQINKLTLKHVVNEQFKHKNK